VEGSSSMNTSNKHMNDMKEMTLENGAPQGDDGSKLPNPYAMSL